MKKRILTYLSVGVLLLGAFAPGISVLAATPTTDVTQTSATNLDPANLADGQYTIDAPLLKTGTEAASLAQTYIDKSAKLVVKDHQLQLTLHINSSDGVSKITDVKTTSDGQPVTVTKNADQTADLTFNVASLSTVTNLSSIINVGASSIAVTMDVKPDTASLKVV
ncbi:NEAT domain-containing protein [Loigolactobacillus zhaoyuanensis]|uniref:NEAT domain-containing protein n=2 Tax=Loigolactobacillus zhaoyuanensis TaxID=2486017 RepID=A0ABW8UBN3_9LACO